MSFEVPIGVSGVFCRFIVKRPNGTTRVDMQGPNNLITDAGRKRMLASSVTSYNFAKLSTDTSPVTPSTTAIPGIVASMESSGDGDLIRDLEKGYVAKRFTWTFPIGAAVGNISKVITGWSSASDTTFSAALIRDSEGNSTSVSVLAGEQVILQWEIRLYWPKEDVTVQLTNEGNKGGVYSCTLRPAYVQGSNVVAWIIGPRSRGNLYLGDASGTPGQAYRCGMMLGEATLGPITGGISSTGGAAPQTSLTKGVSGYSATGVLTASADQANHPDGIGGIYFGTGAQAESSSGFRTAWQAVFDPPLDKGPDDKADIHVAVTLVNHAPEDED